MLQLTDWIQSWQRQSPLETCVSDAWLIRETLIISRWLQLATAKIGAFYMEFLLRPNPNPRDSDICGTPRNKSEVDLLNIVRLKLPARRVKLSKPSSFIFRGREA